MVHALEEISRVLVADGTLIDLRPVSGPSPVHVVSSRGRQEAGHVQPLPEDVEDDAAANRAMAKGERVGLFLRQREALFPFRYSWDSPKEMQEYVEEEWADFAEVDAEVWNVLRSLWAVADADARVGTELKMLITRWVRMG